MKKKLFLLAMCACILLPNAQARKTYIATYDNRLVLIENGVADTLANQAPALAMPSKDGLVSFTLVQQVVSQDLVREIKRAKRAAGWALVSAALSSASEGLSMAQMDSGYDKGWAMQEYVESNQQTNESLAQSERAKAKAESLKTLLLDLAVKNNSQKEMIVTDMDRGLVWFVLPGCEIRLPLPQDEECHLRISSCNPLDEHVKYVNALGTSSLSKYTVALETDDAWYIPVSESTLESLRFTTDQQDGYIRIDRESMAMSTVSDEDFKRIKESR